MYNTIKIDKEKAIEEINNKGQYEDSSILIKKYSSKNSPEKYVSEISKGKSNFIGVLNNKFEREGYGISNYENGDKYIGHFKCDNREENGIYIWAPEIRGKNILTECYYGYWKENKKDKNGIYIWLEEEINNNDFNKANLDIFVGKIEEDTYKRGTYFSKLGDDYYVYHGGFDKEGRKSEDDAYIYSSKYNRFLHGKIVEDNFLNGYVSFFEPSPGEIKDLVYCIFDREGFPKNIKLNDELQNDIKNNEVQSANIFRNFLLSNKFLEYIYSKYKEIHTYIDEKLDNVDILNDKEELNKIISLCAGYNDNNIYNDIEKNVFGIYS